MHVLIGPLLTNTVGEKPETDDLATAQLLWLLLELLSFCVEHHSYHIKSYIINKDLVRRVLVLMNSPHTFLVLGALRLLRKVLALKDELYNRYIIKGCLFGPVVETFKRNRGRYNLLDSAIIEMFEFIKGEDIKLLVSHIMENYSDILEQVTYVQTFRALKIRYEQNQERFKERSTMDSVPALLRNSRYRRDPRQLEEDEEMWFNDEDELEEGEAVVPASNSSDMIGRKIDADLDSIGKLLDKKTESSSVNRTIGGVTMSHPLSPKSALNSASTSPNSLNSTSPGNIDDKANPNNKKIGLVDYDGDSDEEEPEDDSEDNLNSDDKPSAKRARLS
jgi:protein phosphatase-4 regulatory subunit 3